MTFDPFGDFGSCGYLRNFFVEKDPEIVMHLEYVSFVSGVDEAFGNISRSPCLSYQDVLDTHRILFSDLYPWAGQDRLQIAPNLAVSRGDILFAHPQDSRKAVEYALHLGQNKDFMVKNPGEVMGLLAYGHPFLEGNGRAIMLIHAELSKRAGISIKWKAIDKTPYLDALTRELHQPSESILDTYLRPYMEKSTE